MFDVLLAYLLSVPPKGKGPDAAATCGIVKLSGGRCREEEDEEEKEEKRSRSCRGRLSRTGSKDNKLVGLIYRLVGLERLDCKCSRKKIC